MAQYENTIYFLFEEKILLFAVKAMVCEGAVNIGVEEQMNRSAQVGFAAVHRCLLTSLLMRLGSGQEPSGLAFKSHAPQLARTYYRHEIL